MHYAFRHGAILCALLKVEGAWAKAPQVSSPKSKATHQSAAHLNDAPSEDDWLHASGSRLFDDAGREVWLTGLNWFGFNTGTNAFDGLWSVSLSKSIEAITARGFNVMRVPISTELLFRWKQGEYPRANVNEYANPELRGMHSFDVFKAVLRVSKQYGLKIILDVHSAKTDAMGHMHPLWFDGAISTNIFFSAWLWAAETFKNDDTIIGFDLKNEPHGTVSQGYDKAALWDYSNDPNNWRNTAEELGRKILEVHPKVLILVEGTESFKREDAPERSNNPGDYYTTWWGGNLRGVLTKPINLGANQNKLVYSPHDYGPAVFRQSWFQKNFNRYTLYDDTWQPNWAFIQDKGIAPLLIGEWGGFMDGGDNEKWMRALRDFMIDRRIHHTFWCFNANSGDTGGLVNHDFATWDENKYNLVKPALWQNVQGKFISLDHRIPLGSYQTGISLSDL